MEELGHPFWERLTNFFNILCLSLPARSGFEILAGDPMLYWNDECWPGSDWLRSNMASTRRFRAFLRAEAMRRDPCC
jgi:hypothetical protein